MFVFHLKSTKRENKHTIKRRKSEEEEKRSYDDHHVGQARTSQPYLWSVLRFIQPMVRFLFPSFSLI